jgi:leucyl aminopeptidase
MKLTFQSTSITNTSADILAVFVHQDKAHFGKEIKTLETQFGSRVSAITKAGDFAGKLGELALAYPDRGTKAHRVLLVGLGENISRENPNGMLERYRRAAGLALRKAQILKAKSVALALPSLEKRATEGIIAFAEGAGLGLYRYDKYITANNKNTVQSITLCSQEKSVTSVGAKTVAAAAAIIEGTYKARDLSNAPGNEIYPETLAKVAQETGRKSGFKVTVFDEKRIASLGMGGVIGVCKGSARPPRFLVLEYKKGAGQPVVLVGKGVTFDTGGISIKPSASMAEMKMDMSGAAAVIGAFEAVAKLNLKVNLRYPAAL